MSYALESKKRKFHRVLDSISTSNPKKTSTADASTKSQAPSTTPNAAATQTIKRVRLTPGPESDEPAVRPSSGISKRSSGSSSSLRPNFVPWDRTRFLERLQTFRKVDRWSPKPAAINEVQWAKRGWSCTDAMRVKCVGGCGQSLVVKLPDDIDEFEEDDIEKIEERKEVRAKLVEEYTRLIAEGHGEKCPWRRSRCDDTIQRLPLSNREMVLLSLRTRYMNLSTLHDELPPPESLDLPESLDITALLEIVPQEVCSDAKPDNEEQHNAESASNGEAGNAAENEPSGEMTGKSINIAAFSLALFGWDICGDGGAGLASCGACFRRLGLWMYKPKDDGAASVYSHLDVVNEHLDYCPWINAKTQNATEKSEGPGGQHLHSGWEILEQVIRTTHRRRMWADDATSKPGSGSDTPAPDEEIAPDARKAKDREWWARLRRIRQALHVKTHKKQKPTSTASW